MWAVGICTIDERLDFYWGNRIEFFFEFFNAHPNSTAYFVNERFDGEFIFYHLLKNGYEFVKQENPRERLKNNQFTCIMDDKNKLYQIKIGFPGNNNLTIYDALKIVPLSVRDMAGAFNLPIKKGDIDYKKPRQVGYIPDEEEIAYLKNDVEIPARALPYFFDKGLTKMTQAGNALYNYKQTIGKNFKYWFPAPDYDAEVRQSYKGAFTYLNPKFAGIEVGEGIVLDVNSLYPYVMHDKPLPYGEPVHFKGQYVHDDLYNLYTQTFTCEFELKQGMLPTLQIKGSRFYVGTEYLTSSKGKEVTLCMTSVDIELFFEHYDVYNVIYHDGFKWKSSANMFCEYIDYWIGVKNQATIDGNKGLRFVAKIMLNSLYGKFALNPKVQSRYPVIETISDAVHYIDLDPEYRKPLYIPVGSFITAHARYKTITAAQANIERFIYSDTDSIHLLGTEEPPELDIDDVKLGAWKHESTFRRGKFLRAKTYIEEELDEKGKEIAALLEDGLDNLVCDDGKAFLKVTCAGLPRSSYKFVTFDNFQPGQVYSGKMQMKHVSGGIILKDIDFSIKL